MEKVIEKAALFDNDVVVFGLLMLVLAFVFYTASGSSGFWKRFYIVIPPLLLCYFVPGLLNSFHVISGEKSGLYQMSSTYLLPACLVLFTLNINFKEIWRLRKKVGVLFFFGMLGIVLGGPFSVWIFSLFAPHVVEGDVWKALATLAGSWIGGGANQAALYRIFNPPADAFAATIAVDVFVAYGWMAVLLYGASKQKILDRFFRAKDGEVKELTERMQAYRSDDTPTPEVKHYIVMLGVAFGVTAVAHYFAGIISTTINIHAPQLDKFSLTSNFFWVILLATLMGIGLSFTKARKFESMGASKIATVFLYILIATIGMQMDIFAIFKNPGLFLVGMVWMLFHITILFIVAKITRSAFFFFAIGSMGNIGGVASASVTAGAFHPALVPVGVFISVFSYAIGTYAGYLCGILMQMVAP